MISQIPDINADIADSHGRNQYIPIMHRVIATASTKERTLKPDASIRSHIVRAGTSHSIHNLCRAMTAVRLASEA